MDISELKKMLMVENEIEKSQKRTGKNINDQNLPWDKVKVPAVPDVNFFQEGNIVLSKHHRYSKMPEHQHEFVEFNYMLSGKCIQYVNKKKTVLNQGEILLMNKNTVHSIEALGKNDILINVLLKNESINTEIIVNMAKSGGIINEFLLNASNEHSNDNSYILFKTTANYNVEKIMLDLILEYFDKNNYYMRAMNLLLSLLLVELTRYVEKDRRKKLSEEHEKLIEVLRYIEMNYAELTLTKLAEVFGYNPSYLSEKLKKYTGYSFQNLLNITRYQRARELINETDYSHEQIAYKVGYESLGSLYKLLKKYGH